MSNSIDLDKFLNSLSASRALDEHQFEKAKGWNFEHPIELSRELVARQWLTKWQARQILNGKIDLFVGKYKISKAIQKNRNFSILAARHEQMNRSAVLYVTNQRENVNDFLKKARRLAELNHPNLQHVYDFDHDLKTCFLVMESVQGDPLVEHLRSQKNSPAQMLCWFSQLTEALDHMHKAQIAHGAISLTRVTYDTSKNAKLVGVAESISGDRPIMLNTETLRHDIDSWYEVLDELIGGAASVDGQKEFGNTVRTVLNDRFKSEPKKSFLSMIAKEFSELRKELETEEFDDALAPSRKKKPQSNLQPREKITKPTRRNLMVASASIICLIAIVFFVWNSFFRSGFELTSTAAQPQSVVGGNQMDRSDSTADDLGLKPLTARLDFGQAGPINMPETRDGAPSDDVIETLPSYPQESFSDATINELAAATPKSDKNDSNPETETVAGSTDQVKNKDNDESDENAPAKDEPDELQNPFTGTEFAVTLPVAKKSGNVSSLELGRIHADGIKLFADLLGGDSAHRNAANFELKDAGSNRWKVVMRDPRTDSQEAIATLEITDGALVFLWNSVQNKFSLANHLRNCIVRFRYADFSYIVALRNDALQVPPISVGCWKPAHAKRVSIRYAPAMEAMRYEVVEVLPQELEQALNPNSNSPMSSPIKISIGTKSRHSLLFQLSKLPRRPISMVVTPLLKIPGNDEFQAISRDRFLQFKNQIMLQKEAKKARKKQFDTMLRRLVERGISNEQKENLKVSYKTRERIIKETEEQIVELSSICHAMETTIIRYRVFLPIGDHEIELLRCDPSETDLAPKG